MFFFVGNLQVICQNRPDQGYDFDVNRRFDVPYVRNIKNGLLQEYKVSLSTRNNTADLMRKLAFIYFHEVPPITDSSLYWSEKLITYGKQKNNDYYLVEGLIKKAEFYERFGPNYRKVMEAYNEALINDNISKNQRLFIKRCIATIYSKTDNPATPSYVEQFLKEVQSDKEPTDNEKARDVYNLNVSLADYYERKKQHKLALDALVNALDAVYKFNDGIGPAYLYANIAKNYLQLDDYRNTEKYLDKAKRKFDSLKLDDFTLHLLRMRMYIKLDDHKKAVLQGEEILDKAQKRQFKRFGITHKEVHNLLYLARKELNDYEKSLLHFEEYVLVKDSLDRQVRAREVEEIQKKFDIELHKKESEKQILAKNNEIKNLELATFQQKLKQQKLEEELLREQYLMQKVNYANHAKSLAFLKEQNKSGKKLRENLEAKLQLEQENRWLQWVGLLLLLTIFSGVGIWSFSKNKERYKYQNLKSEYQERVARIEVMALRAQMNPHFIFNCLNGIILFIDKNQNEVAISYLAKFSKLIRKVLENSASETITLDQEIQALRLYLEIEHMRFGEKLVYEIFTDSSLDLEEIHIPSMIIQPFVENAIWHGLMHKEEGGTVKIKLTKKDEKSLVIEIIDNGIGREEAERLKSKSALKHKSFSMKITAERMEILNRLYSTASSVDIIDLKDGGHSAGTHVKIDLPI